MPEARHPTRAYLQRLSQLLREGSSPGLSAGLGSTWLTLGTGQAGLLSTGSVGMAVPRERCLGSASATGSMPIPQSQGTL